MLRCNWNWKCFDCVDTALAVARPTGNPPLPGANLIYASRHAADDHHVARDNPAADDHHHAGHPHAADDHRVPAHQQTANSPAVSSRGGTGTVLAPPVSDHRAAYPAGVLGSPRATP